MNGILKVTRFQLRDSRNAVAIFYAVILGLLSLVAMVALRSPGSNSSVGGLGLSSVVFIFILGLNCFTSAFRFMQANGVSRKRFFFATVLALVIIAIFMSVVDIILGLAIGTLVRYSGVVEQLYGISSLIPELTFNTALAVFAAMAGWMISMIYYRSNKLQKVLVSLSPLFALTIFIYLNRYTAGALGTAIVRFLGTALGFFSGPSPYVAMLSFSIGAAITAGLCFLLIRNAPVKD